MQPWLLKLLHSFTSPPSHHVTVLWTPKQAAVQAQDALAPLGDRGRGQAAHSHGMGAISMPPVVDALCSTQISIRLRNRNGVSFTKMSLHRVHLNEGKCARLAPVPALWADRLTVPPDAATLTADQGDGHWPGRPLAPQAGKDGQQSCLLTARFLWRTGALPRALS